jgi:hypothetical protein
MHAAQVAVGILPSQYATGIGRSFNNRYQKGSKMATSRWAEK